MCKTTNEKQKTAQNFQDVQLTVDKQPTTIAPVSRKITFVNIIGAPQEMADLPVSTVVSSFGKILSHRRGHWQSHPEWENGVRHYIMELNTDIPSYIEAGSYKLHVKYNGQIPTCRKCAGQGHIAAQCPNDVCFNCGLPGHHIASCPNLPKCKTCGEDHLTRQCPISYRNITRRPPRTMTMPPPDEQYSATEEKETHRTHRNLKRIATKKKTKTDRRKS